MALQDRERHPPWDGVDWRADPDWDWHSAANDETWSLRWILVHMIEQCARHNGHADLLRGSVDGLVGE